MSASILVIEDDKAIRNFIKTALNLNHYDCEMASCGQEGLMLAVSRKPDIVVLDLGLPDIDGVDIITKIRSWSYCPIIVVSARSEDKDKIEALDAGADDYLTKPFSVDELMARIRVAIRKMSYDQSKVQNDPVFMNGGLRIEYEANSVYVDDILIHLTPIEYKLICLLAKNVGKVLTHNYILKEVWGTCFESDIPSLRVFMATLRRKIEKNPGTPEYLQTHIGVGYRLIRIQGENHA